MSKHLLDRSVTVRLSPREFEVLTQHAESYKGNLSKAFRKLLKASANEQSAA